MFPRNIHIKFHIQGMYFNVIYIIYVYNIPVYQVYYDESLRKNDHPFKNGGYKTKFKGILCCQNSSETTVFLKAKSIPEKIYLTRYPEKIAQESITYFITPDKNG